MKNRIQDMVVIKNKEDLLMKKNMNKKEIKNLAKQIAKAESTIQNSTDQKERKYAMDTIIALSSKLSSLEEIERVDEMVQKILKNNS